MSSPDTRIERDSIGEREVPVDAYYGIQTLRAMENFPVSGMHERPVFIHAYIVLKKAAALANMELGTLDHASGEAIVNAADEALEGAFDDQFTVDVFQAGAGTSFHMNINEVLANRALELLGRPRGAYEILSPNDHVNMAQSTNDTFPTATHIAVIWEADRLIDALVALAGAFERKGEEFAHLPKSGRTHLMDALPLTLGDEFAAYGAALHRAADRIRNQRDDLCEVAIGGTATGTGANAHPRFRETVLEHLSRLASLDLHHPQNSFEALQSRSQLGAFSASLRGLALELIRIANDLRLLGSGPTTGLAEIALPHVQPGSSIMAGKVNPVMAECLDMVAFRVIGNDTTVALAVQAGQIDLNVMTPVMTHAILESLAIMTSYLPVFQERCVEGIIADERRLQGYLEQNPILATLLAPRVGYLKAAEIAREAQEKGVPVRDVAVLRGVVSKQEADRIFDPQSIARSHYE